MAAWKKEELDRFGKAEEVDIAPRLPDGGLGNRVTIWAVQHGDALWIRSAVKGHDAAWYRGVQATHAARIWAPRLELDVELEDAGQEVAGEIDAAYRKKYRQYAGRILNSCLTPEARATTLKVAPA